MSPTDQDLGFGRVARTPDELVGLYGSPSTAVRRKAIDHIDRHCRDFIARSPFLLVASADREGRCDVSPRGGPAGFVSVLDEHRLLVPDAPGNRRIDSLQNVLENGHLGLLFLVPGVDETLRVNGRAVVVLDSALLSDHPLANRAAKVGLGVHVDEAFLHCAKAFKRSSLWHAEGWPSTQGLAGAAEMFRDHVALPDVTLERVQRFLDEDYACNLY